MKHAKRFLLMVLIALFVLGGALWLYPNEDMYFVVSDHDDFTLYEMGDDLVAVPILNTENPIVVEDGIAAWFEYEDASHSRWNLVTYNLATGEKRCIENGTVDGYEGGFDNLQLSDGYAYYPYLVSEEQRLIDAYIVEAKLDGSGGRVFRDLKYFGWAFQVLDGKLYYIEYDASDPYNVSSRPVVYDMETGTEEYLSDREAWMPFGYFYLNRGRFWYVTAEENLENYEAVDEIPLFLSGISLKNGDVVEIPYANKFMGNHWINDGYLYTFRNWRQEEYTVADLYQTNLRTQRSKCIAEGIPIDENYPPDITFGKRGMVILGSSRRIDNLDHAEFSLYILYDGSAISKICFSE